MSGAICLVNYLYLEKLYNLQENILLTATFLNQYNLIVL